MGRDSYLQLIVALKRCQDVTISDVVYMILKRQEELEQDG